MTKIGDNFKLLQTLEKAKGYATLPSAASISREMALSLIESCRQGTSPNQNALVLAVGRQEQVTTMRQDLKDVSNGGSCLRIINGVFGMGKSFTLRILQEYAYFEGFATSFITLSSRECPIYELQSIYRNIVKSIRTSECKDRPALEMILEDWAKKIKEDKINRILPNRILGELDTNFKEVLTQYYEWIHFGSAAKSEVALRWLLGEATSEDCKRLGINSNISSENALDMLGNLTRMIRYMNVKGLVILLDEVDAIPNISNTDQRETAYQNLLKLSAAASSTPYSYFAYSTTPALFKSTPYGFENSIKNITDLQQLNGKELNELVLT